MKKLRQRILLVAEAKAVESVLKKLAGKFLIEEAATESNKKVYFDTFDWRLYRTKTLFAITGQRFELNHFNGSILAEGEASPNQGKFFWWDMKTPAFQERLKHICAMRALLPVTEVQERKRELNILNSEKKTIARLLLQNDKRSGNTNKTNGTAFLTINEVRGYDRPYELIRSICSGPEFREITKEQLVENRLSGSRRKPLDYGDKFGVFLEHDISIANAVSRICLSLVDDMEKNHVGVCRDIDSEFLHDFRIAVRRTRSLLSLLKNVLPTGMKQSFGPEFNWLGMVTGPVRDIDVYLLEKESYLNMLPSNIRDGMNVFFTDLQQRRLGELELLKTHLTSTRYYNLIENWKAYLSKRDSALTESACLKPCKSYADTLIRKRFEKFISEGDKIGRDSSDRELHRLRIRGKKLRYLLEFFKSFYNDTEMRTFLKQLKKLQEHLGCFNDLSVQKDMLAVELNLLKGRNKESIRLASAFGGLIALLAAEHRKVRRQFSSTYAQFATRENKILLENMVAGSDGESPGKRGA